jgi:hypothetical protein
MINYEGWILTRSGVKFDLFNPHPSMINIEDIAHALANICRFGGHTDEHYSVAQHSVLVSNIVPDEDAMCGLLHDATEAYIGDMVSPLKHFIPKFKEVEQNLWVVVCERFGLSVGMPASVKHADLVMLATERHQYLPESEPWDCIMGIEPRSDLLDLKPWGFTSSRSRFLNKYKELL